MTTLSYFGDAESGEIVLASIDTLRKGRTSHQYVNFHLEVYIKAPARAGMSTRAHEQAVGDFLTDSL